MHALLQLRPADPDDEPFLRELRAQIDAERLGLQFWEPAAQELAQKVLETQFRAHRAHYRTVQANWDTKDCIIELDRQRAGRFILTQDAKVVHLADLAVHGAHRGKGIGQAVIDAIKAECIVSRRTLRLHVDPLSPAAQFYLHLGFRIVAQHDTHYLMEWVPPSAPGPALHFSPAKP